MPSPVKAVSDAAGTAVSGALAALAAARRGKAVHPHGVVYRATVTLDGSGPRGSVLLSTPGEHEALVRFSRSLGVPRPLPDLLGMAIRIPDAYGAGAHQDFLLVTSVDLPVLHHVFLPARDIHQRPYSSSLPYRAGDETFLVGAVPHGEAFGLAVAPVGGRFRSIGAVTLGDRLPDTLDALRFNPVHTGGGLDLAGVLNRWRRRAYPWSQAAWRTARAHGDEEQRAAERDLQRL